VCLPLLSADIGAPTSSRHIQMEQQRINANVNSLSQKLLEGCKLLSDSCPETNVPLVSTPDGRMYSVGNGCYYVREGSELVKAPADAAPAGPPPQTPAAHSSPGRGGFLAPSVRSIGNVEPPSAPPTDQQSLSSRVAAKLLEGFTLLSESCPVTSVPLVQDAQGRILSVGTGRWYERTGGELIEAPGAASPAVALMAPQPPPQQLMPPPPPPAFRGYGTPAAHHGQPGTPQPAASAHQPTSLPSYSYSYGAPAAPPAPASASSHVHSAVLQAAGTPVNPRVPYGASGAASFKASSQEAVAVLTSRLAEATSALADAPLREAGTYVTMIKDIALAIGALKTV
jgi:uncharacterized Zn finger protein (UPF0148 family)